MKFGLANTCKKWKNHKIRISKRSYIIFEIFGKIKKIQENIFNIYKKWKQLFK